MTNLCLLYFQIGKLEKELKQSEKLRLSNDSLIQDLQARLNSADNMRRHLEDENKVGRSQFTLVMQSYTCPVFGVNDEVFRICWLRMKS